MTATESLEVADCWSLVGILVRLLYPFVSQVASFAPFYTGSRQFFTFATSNCWGFAYSWTLFNFVASPTVAVSHVILNSQLSLNLNDFWLLCHGKSLSVWTPIVKTICITVTLMSTNICTEWDASKKCELKGAFTLTTGGRQVASILWLRR